MRNDDGKGSLVLIAVELLKRIFLIKVEGEYLHQLKIFILDRIVFTIMNLIAEFN